MIYADEAYRKLKTLIYKGKLRPGQRLVERQLATRLKISRIPLRESLARLENEGLVRTIPNSATYVEDFPPRQVLEMYSMRLLLEPEATRLATVQQPAGLVGKLRKLCGQMTKETKVGDWARLDQTDYEFHYAIVEASKHSLLLRSYENCHIQITGIRSDYNNLKHLPVNATAKDHLAIVDCIAAGDPAGAARATHEHVARALRAMETHLGIDLGTQK
ncbi:MAG: GntR family transcriptional regulator [Verrucomicrobiota bacterium]